MAAMKGHPSVNHSTGNSLAPSRSTVYVSNLPFSLTNTDLHKIFEKFGKLVRVTILRDKKSHKSRGVAFLLFLKREEAQACVRGTNNCEMFGRTLKASIAKDNGRAPEFIRRREYPDKSRCYECGELGHLSYSCPKNILGNREPPKKKLKKKQKNDDDDATSTYQKAINEDIDDDDDEDDGDFDDESLSAAIRYQQELREAEEFQNRIISGDYRKTTQTTQKSRITQSTYFSDEEEENEVDT
ncbi:zinc finger CCHC-type and RNA-binding motif-containing protein 1-like [Macrobrachium rosenbergii]|uniref:zinc finger CCHC-type and RNA-binding motif-containing protein 1-like n=1 Tax=Macrobrachium rosenbergii TaxID=79674 RepID=UPI0034D6A3A6